MRLLQEITLCVTIISCWHSLVASKCHAQPWAKHGRLTVHEANAHYLAHADGTPFLWIGDTAWELIHRLSREEVLRYLQDRKDKGFNVIQAVAISEGHEEIPVNYYGDSLFRKDNPLQPVVANGSSHLDPKGYDYWDHLEYTIDLAQRLGLYIALLPTWGEWVIPRGKKPLFNSAHDAYQYGWFISNRLKQYPNIIWILGGDRHPTERKNGVEIWRGMAEGLADGTNSENNFDGEANYATTLMTYHSYQSSSEWFHDDPWIDFHMWGSYHSDYYLSRSYEQSASDWALENPKPTINGEPSYEDHPVNYALPGNGVFGEVDVRNAAYWTFFSGGAGYTYGAHPVWQFADSLRPAYSDLTFRPWQQALDLPGALDIIHFKNLIESRPIENLVPDQTMIISGQGPGANYVSAIHGQHHAWVYVPTGNDIEVKAGLITGKSLSASWYDPRTGTTIPIGTYENKGSLTFEVPGMPGKVSWLRRGRGCDWVLMLDDASMNFPRPGEQ